MIKKIWLLIFILTLLTSVAGKNAFGHGNSQSFPKDVGDYTIELEYDATGLFDDSTTPFVFRILDQKTKEAVKFDSILVRYERDSDKSTTFVGRIYPDELQDGVGRFTAMLNSGDYTVTLGFYQKDKKIAETEYTISVSKGEGSKKFPLAEVLIGLGGLVVGFFASKIKTSNEK